MVAILGIMKRVLFPTETDVKEIMNMILTTFYNLKLRKPEHALIITLTPLWFCSNR